MCYHQDDLELLAHGDNKKQSHFVLLLLTLKLSTHNAPPYYLYLVRTAPTSPPTAVLSGGLGLQWAGLGFPAEIEAGSQQ